MTDADPEILARRVRPPDRTEVTGPEATDVYDVWEPEPQRARGVTVALVHGGFWRERYDRTHVAPLAEALARDGFHVASLEYPRAGMPDGAWPGPATAVLERLAAVQGDTDLPSPLVLVGHSAGGQLVLWVASEERAPGVRGVVALAPVADLGEADRRHLGDDAARELLGGGPQEQPDRWADADPARHRLTTPAIIVTGEHDDVVPGAVAQAYVATRSDGEPLHTAVARGADHFDVIDPDHPAYLLVLAEVEELLLR